MNKKMMILSIDALQTQDLPMLSTLPNFSKILKKASIVKDVREVYPTLTNVNHVSIITGVTPDKHKVFHNMRPFVPTKNVDWNMVGKNWFWKSEYIKVPTIVDAAKKKGLVTACISWPSMGGQVPDYNLAELWSKTKSTVFETFDMSCTKNIMDQYFEKYIQPFPFHQSSDIDAFTVPIAVDLIKTQKPDLLLEHIIWLDYTRHKNGNNHPVKIREALERIDTMLGQLLDAYKEAGTYENTNFFIMGDHGQMNIKESFHINVYLRQSGLIQLDEQGEVLDYDAYSFSAGFSTQIILKDPENKELVEKVQKVLHQMQQEYPEYIEKIYTKQEVEEQEHLSGGFSFVVEAISGICFENMFEGPMTLSSESSDYKVYPSNHGYHPSKGPKPTLIAFGPDIQENKVIQGASVLDECPTFAKVLGVNMSGLMGKAFDFLK